MEIVTKLKQVFEQVEELTPEKAKELIQGTLKLFQELKGQMASEDPVVRAEAIEKAKEIKAALELQMNQLARSTYLNPLVRAKAIQVPPPSEKDQTVLQTIREEVVNYKKTLLPQKKRKKAKTLIC